MIKVYSDPSINNQNTYLVVNSKTAVLIDAGSAVEQALAYVSKHEILITAIIITHGHFDHLLGLNTVLKLFPKVEVIINKLDYPCLHDIDRNRSNAYFSEGFKVTEKITKIRKLEQEIVFLDLINYHFTIKHIMGHTPGSQYIIIDELNALFVGDSVFYDKIGFYQIPYANPNKFKASLKEIINLPINYQVYPGHHQSFKLYEVQTHNKILVDFLQEQ